MAAMSGTKFGLLFKVINESRGFYQMPVSNGARSRVNVPFRVCTASGPDPDLENKFVKAAEKAKIIHIQGHRSVGGMRASLYNAVTIANTQVLVDFMVKFMAEHNIEQ